MAIELLNIENAPEASAPLLEGVQKKMGGFLPKLYQQMANAPAVLEAYLTLSGILAKTSYSPAEQQLILLTASAWNGCKYCVAAHSSGARMAKLDKDVIEAIRNGDTVENPKLQVLRAFTEDVLETRGKIGEDSKNDFFSAGYTEVQAMELLIAISMKALSNSFSRMFDTPLDQVLTSMEWAGNDRV